jgi:two-component system, LuxR family, response regulator FixJ
LNRLAPLSRLCADRLELPLVLITGHGDTQPAVRATRGGGVDCAETPFDAQALVTAMAAGPRCRRCDTSESEDPEAARQRLRGLSQREQEVLRHIVAGDSNKAVAGKLGVSPRTIEFHRAHIMEKTGARGLPDLVRLWLAAHPSRSEGLTGRLGPDLRP